MSAWRAPCCREPHRAAEARADRHLSGRRQCRPAAAAGGRLDWKAMAWTPKTWIFSKPTTPRRARSRWLGVPPMLLGIPGDNTLANYQEANRSFWRQTVLPLAGRVGNALAQWPAPLHGDGLRLEIDTDRIEALSGDRAALWQRVADAQFLTVNEKREAVGYGPLPDGDHSAELRGPCRHLKR
ncbi:MAG: phage portal protein [Rhodopseudomonas palustris]|nr:phage portal protein [Rhodopseudomonas palustris]